MGPLFENLLDRLSTQWKQREPSKLGELSERRARGRAHRCQCGRQIFFRNSVCLGCQAPLGFAPEWGEVRALAVSTQPGKQDLFRLAEGGSELFRRCANFTLPAGCNWMIAAGDPHPLCVACRLNRTIPNLSGPDNGRYWHAIEVAKRRLASQLLALGLPLRSKLHDDPDRGLMFDFLRSPPDGPPVLTGHAQGLITLNVEEADDAKRETIKHTLREPYRTLLGHFRHEVGHYYWSRLVDESRWLAPYREMFGDDRADYGAALARHYENGPPADWRDRFISAYAASHPWEDWAETWAHYLHVSDSLDTALGFGLEANALESEIEPFGPDDLYAPDDPSGAGLLTMINAWVELMMVMNELARSLGQPDIYPFVMSRAVVKKMHFIHMVVQDAKLSAAAADAQ